ncbi:MAG: RusA family crossover junction endodeoxyribonuclease [Tannerella sp.]|jgi:Holliday junction resolvase RusA-like endonuclease|nr:RusA family crossover junction endodeoxyribonuclease [Tannerella sp.]
MQIENSKIQENERQIILGQCPSKSNSYRIITLGGHGSLAKTEALKAYEKSFYLQCGKYRNARIKGLFELYVDVYNGSSRPDLDNAMKAVLDCLQQCNAIENDRNCIKITAQKFIDKTNPRIEFIIKEI